MRKYISLLLASVVSSFTIDMYIYCIQIQKKSSCLAHSAHHRNYFMVCMTLRSKILQCDLLANKETNSVAGRTTRSQTFQCVLDTTESYSAVWAGHRGVKLFSVCLTPQSRTPRRAGQRGVKFFSVSLTPRSSTPGRAGQRRVKFLSVCLTQRSCTPWRAGQRGVKFFSVPLTPWSRTPRRAGHRGVHIFSVSLTPRSRIQQ